MQGISAKARLVCWINPTLSVLTPVICDLQIRVCDAVVAILAARQEPRPPNSGNDTMIGCFHNHAEIQILYRSSFCPRIAHGDLDLSGSAHELQKL